MSITDEREPHNAPYEYLRKQRTEAEKLKVEGKTNAEIAKALGITENYVRGLIGQRTQGES